MNHPNDYPLRISWHWRAHGQGAWVSSVVPRFVALCPGSSRYRKQAAEPERCRRCKRFMSSHDAEECSYCVRCAPPALSEEKP